MITLASLVAAGIGPTQARLFETPLQAACARYGIDTPLREAAFVAQCAHESRLFTALEESLFYRTPERICAIFRSSVPTLDVARGLACNPKALANHAYANRNGNGNEASGDGWRYRGRGLIQLTGRANYLRASTDTTRPYLDEPDLMLDPAEACIAAAWFWHSRNLNALADASRIDDITRSVNGAAMAGAAERRLLFSAALAAFKAAAPTTRGAPATRGTQAPSGAEKPTRGKPVGAARKLAAERSESESTTRKSSAKKASAKRTPAKRSARPRGSAEPARSAPAPRRRAATTPRRTAAKTTRAKR